MTGFTKLHSGIIDSSIWEEDYPTRIVWVTFLAKADRSGNVIGVSKRNAASANVSIEEYDRAIKVLSSPDPNSKTPDQEGRRITPIPGGWHLVNYAKYRQKRDPEKRREQNRQAQQRHRDHKNEQKPVSKKSAKISQNKPIAEAEAEADIKEIYKEKKSQYLDYVYLKPEEHQKLIARLGLTTTNEYIERLNNYVGSKGKKYKSHYYTILGWANKDGVKPPLVVRDKAGKTPADLAREKIAQLRKEYEDDKATNATG